MNWPWTNQEKELEKCLKEVEDGKVIEIKNVDSIFDEIKNHKYSFWEDLWLSVKFKSYDFSWWVYYLFNPCHKRIRKVIPRKWRDLSELTLLVNFEIIKSYVEEEMDSVVWDHGEYKLAGDWLRSAYNYITKERAALQKEFDEALTVASNDMTKRNLPYAERYGETNRIEKLIDDKDREVLVNLAKYRQYLWT